MSHLDCPIWLNVYHSKSCVDWLEPKITLLFFYIAILIAPTTPNVAPCRVYFASKICIKHAFCSVYFFKENITIEFFFRPELKFWFDTYRILVITSDLASDTVFTILVFLIFTFEIAQVIDYNWIDLKPCLCITIVTNSLPFLFFLWF